MSAVGFWVAAPFWTFGLTFNEAVAYRSVNDFALVLGISAIGTAAMGGILLIAHRTVLRDRSRTPVAVPVFTAVVIAAAMVRLLVFLCGMSWLGLTDDVPLPTRVVGSALLAIVAFGVMAYAGSLWSGYADERRRLLRGIIESEEQLSIHRAAVEAMSSTLQSSVERRVTESRLELRSALDRLADSIGSGTSGHEEFHRLRRVADDSWRRITVDTWRGVPITLPPVGARELVATMVNGTPFSGGLYVVAAVLMHVFVFSRVTTDLSGAVLATGTWAGVCWAVAMGANVLISSMQRGRSAVFLLAVIMQLLAVIPVLVLRFVPTEDAFVVVRVVVVISLTLFLVVCAGIPPAVAAQQSKILGVLSRHLDSSTLRRMQVESRFVTISQRIATRLHGHARGSFLASSLRLKTALDRGDSEQALAIIRAMQHELSEPLADTEPGPWQRPDLEEFLDNWAGIIQIDIDPRVFTVPDEQGEAVQTIIIDAVTNAVRHGACSRVSVDLEARGSTLVLRIDSDGAPPSTTKQGLGTANLERFAPERWSRTARAAGGTRVLAELR